MGASYADLRRTRYGCATTGLTGTGDRPTVRREARRALGSRARSERRVEKGVPP